MMMFSIGLFAVKLFSTKYYLCKHWLFVGDKQESANRRIGLPNIAIVECAPKTQKTAELVSKVLSPDMIIVQNFTPPDLQANNMYYITPYITAGTTGSDKSHLWFA